jgi:fucose 4-O-acetylase-like acetyltransferase
MGVTAGLRDELDQLVESTPQDRDRYVDFLRAFAIAVVVLWHWVFSITHWEAGELVMPNPIEHVPGAWLATWLLQIMPLFFFVGGFANLATWQSVRDDGEGTMGFYRKRLRRLLIPVAAFVGAWMIFEAFAHLLVPGYRGVLAYGMIVIVPLWFLAAYLWVVALVPVTARLHERTGSAGAAGLAALVLAVDAARFGLGLEGLGWLNTAMVWVVVHQLGYLYRDGTLLRAGRGGQVLVALAGLALLAALTSLEAYPRSMVAVPGQEHSNIYPTNAAILGVAGLQAGVALLLRGPVCTWLERRVVWKAVVATNAVIMTVFLWHMTGLVAAVGVYEALGGQLLAEPTAAWWAQRPLWLLGPALLTAPLVALFSPLEMRS